MFNNNSLSSIDLPETFDIGTTVLSARLIPILKNKFYLNYNNILGVGKQQLTYWRQPNLSFNSLKVFKSNDINYAPNIDEVAESCVNIKHLTFKFAVPGSLDDNGSCNTIIQ